MHPADIAGLRVTLRDRRGTSGIAAADCLLHPRARHAATRSTTVRSCRCLAAGGDPHSGAHARQRLSSTRGGTGSCSPATSCGHQGQGDLRASVLQLRLRHGPRVGRAADRVRRATIAFSHYPARTDDANGVLARLAKRVHDPAIHPQPAALRRRLPRFKRDHALTRSDGSGVSKLAFSRRKDGMERDLVQRAQIGDREAFSDACQHADRWPRCRCPPAPRDPGLAEDATQQALRMAGASCSAARPRSLRGLDPSSADHLRKDEIDARAAVRPSPATGPERSTPDGALAVEQRTSWSVRSHAYRRTSIARWSSCATTCSGRRRRWPGARTAGGHRRLAPALRDECAARRDRSGCPPTGRQRAAGGPS